MVVGIEVDKGGNETGVGAGVEVEVEVEEETIDSV